MLFFYVYILISLWLHVFIYVFECCCNTWHVSAQRLMLKKRDNCVTESGIRLAAKSTTTTSHVRIYLHVYLHILCKMNVANTKHGVRPLLHCMCCLHLFYLHITTILTNDICLIKRFNNRHKFFLLSGLLVPFIKHSEKVLHKLWDKIMLIISRI